MSDQNGNSPSEDAIWDRSSRIDLDRLHPDKDDSEMIARILRAEGEAIPDFVSMSAKRAGGAAKVECGSGMLAGQRLKRLILPLFMLTVGVLAGTWGTMLMHRTQEVRVVMQAAPDPWANPTIELDADRRQVIKVLRWYKLHFMPESYGSDFARDAASTMQETVELDDEEKAAFDSLIKALDRKMTRTDR